MEPETLQFSLLVPRDLVKTLKDALEKHNKLDKSRKIETRTDPPPARPPAATSTLSHSQGNGEPTTETERETYVVPTTITVGCDATPDELERVKTGLLKELGMDLHEDAVHVTTTNIITTTTTTTNAPSQPKPTALTAPIHSWLTHDLPPTLLESLHINISTLLAAFPTRYTIYPPLLLLAPNTFTTPPWPTLLASLSPSQLDRLYTLLCASLKTTHVAINAPIPAHVSSPSPLPLPSLIPSNKDPSRSKLTETENTLRSPTGLRLLHGSFGPSPSPSQPHNPPTSADFAATLWVSTRQNTIYQTWAPLHTMFSRGNVSEKARVLRFASAPSPTTCSEALLGSEEERRRRRRWGGKCTAVDLYAGIGYFAFSYAKSEGVARVLGWEVSGWSVEGLRRGAGGNGWGVRVVGGGGDDDGEEGEEGGRGVDGWEDGGEKIVVFREDNLNALRRIEGMREKLPPVRHVNCGLLPTSRASWEVAVGVLDPVEGGWIHAHENIAVKDIESTKDEIVEVFTKLVNNERRKVECQHLERVKTYAPGVMHCVLDIYISPTPYLTAAATATTPPPNAPAQVDYNTVQSTSADNAR